MEVYLADIVPDVKAQLEPSCLGIFFAGCDFRCPSCDVPDLLEFRPDARRDEKVVRRVIRDLNPSSVLFTGGEPLLQQEAIFALARFCKLKKLQVGVDTNGSKPQVLRRLYEAGLIDYVCLDVKAPFDSASFDKVTRASTFFKPAGDILSQVKESLSFLREVQGRLRVDARTLIVPGLMYRKEDILAIAKELDGFKGRWLLTPMRQDRPVLAKRYQSISPPSSIFLQTLKDAVSKRYPDIDVQVDIT